MRHTNHPALRAALGTFALLAAFAASAQETSTDKNVDPPTAAKQAREVAQGGPARWEHEDMSVAARLRNLRKEIGAALQEAKNACRSEPASSRSACLREARKTYEQDMAAAPARAKETSAD